MKASQLHQKFLNQFRLKRFKKGEIILCQGEQPDSAYAVNTGVVKTYNLTTSGEEKPIGFDVAGDLFPAAFVFGQVSCAQYYYEAFTDCTVRCIPPGAYSTFLHEQPDVLLHVFESFVQRYMGAQMRINALEQSKASLKVINTLHFFCLRYGELVKKDVVQIGLPLTQQDFANFIGLTRETTGIELKKLQSAGVLTYRKQKYIVRTTKLSALLDEDHATSALLLEGSAKSSVLQSLQMA